MRVLFAEDEHDLNQIVTRKLISDGYSVDSFLNGREALEALDVADYDVIILDIMMPGTDGLTVLSALRKSGKTTPVLFLTARDTITDKVKGLDSGANDYLVKPFSLEELMARIRVLTRSSFGMVQNILTVGNLTMDCGAHIVKRGNREIALSSKEYALLEYLMHNQGIVLSREKIENHIWNFEYEGGTNVVDVYIRYLRKKIDNGYDTKLIHTVRGTGYVLREET